MKKHYFRIILTVVLFVGMVAVGVHALNKKARAEVTYTVECRVWVNQEQWEPVEDLYIEIWASPPGEEAEFTGTTDEEGIVSHVRGDWFGNQWMIYWDQSSVPSHPVEPKTGSEFVGGSINYKVLYFDLGD